MTKHDQTRRSDELALCLSGTLGRFPRPHEIASSGSNGSMQLVVDLIDVPSSNGRVAIQPGSTWIVQTWYRDPVPGGDPSNTSTAVAVTFR